MSTKNRTKPRKNLPSRLQSGSRLIGRWAGLHEALTYRFSMRTQELAEFVPPKQTIFELGSRSSVFQSARLAGLPDRVPECLSRKENNEAEASTMNRTSRFAREIRAKAELSPAIPSGNTRGMFDACRRTNRSELVVNLNDLNFDDLGKAHERWYRLGWHEQEL